MAVLVIRHIELKTANEFIERIHRHHKKVIGHRFSIGCYEGEKLVGVAIVGRPVARGCNFLDTVEVTRLCTDGTKNACSFLYSAAARASKELGYRKIQTYILETENGVSVEAASWKYEYTTQGGEWKGTLASGKTRKNEHPVCKKKLYSKEFY